MDYSKLYKDMEKVTLQSSERIIPKGKLPKTPKPEIHSNISNNEVSNKSGIIEKHFLAILFVATMLVAGIVNSYIINDKIHPEFSLIQKLTHKVSDEEQSKYEKLDKENK